MKHRILILLSAILISLVGTAQDNVAGVILNEKGKPAKKIKMRVKGRMKILSTSSKGIFELDNVKTGDTLLVYPNRKLVAYVPMSGIPTYTIHCAMPRMTKRLPACIRKYRNKPIIAILSLMRESGN